MTSPWLSRRITKLFSLFPVVQTHEPRQRSGISAPELSCLVHFRVAEVQLSSSALDTIVPRAAWCRAYLHLQTRGLCLSFYLRSMRHSTWSSSHLWRLLLSHGSQPVHTNKLPGADWTFGYDIRPFQAATQLRACLYDLTSSLLILQFVWPANSGEF